MKRELVQILACSKCKGELYLEVTEENEKEILNGSLTCKACGVKYTIENGIPVFVPAEKTSG